MASEALQFGMKKPILYVQAELQGMNIYNDLLCLRYQRWGGQ